MLEGSMASGSTVPLAEEPASERKQASGMSMRYAAQQSARHSAGSWARNKGKADIDGNVTLSEQYVSAKDA